METHTRKVKTFTWRLQKHDRTLPRKRLGANRGDGRNRVHARVVGGETAYTTGAHDATTTAKKPKGGTTVGLVRHWTPTNNYSYGNDQDLLVIHSMEGFTGPNGAKDCAIYFQGNVGASSQVCIDNNRGHIWEGVSRANGSWTQCGYNYKSISCEQSGYASWSRQYWLDTRENQLRNIADWLAEESKITGIPLVNISSPGQRGVIYHSELGSTGCGHSDPGAGFPLDVVLEWAKGDSSPAPSTSGDNVVSNAVDPDGNKHYVCIDTNGILMYFPPGWANWGRIDPQQKGAKSGAGISITNDFWVTLTYTNSSGQPCQYRKKWLEGEWGWSAIGSLNAR